MSGIEVTLTANTDRVMEDFEAACERALTRIGMQAETFAKEKCPVDTGNLRNSISNKVNDKSAFVGTNVEYAPYVELGTSRAKAQPFIKPAATEQVV